MNWIWVAVVVLAIVGSLLLAGCAVVWIYRREEDRMHGERADQATLDVGASWSVRGGQLLPLPRTRDQLKLQLQATPAELLDRPAVIHIPAFAALPDLPKEEKLTCEN